MRRPLSTASLFLWLLPVPAAADDMTERLENARRHYEAGRLGKASTELQWAMVRLRNRLEVLARESLPSTPPGWRIDGNVPSHMGAASFGVHLFLNYRSETAPMSHVNVQVAIDSPQMMGQCNNFALLNPVYAQLQGYAPIEIEGLANPALLRVNEAQRSAEGIITVPGRICIYMRGSGADPGGAVRTLIAGWKIKQLKESFDIP